MPQSLRTSLLRNLSHAANDLFWFILPLLLPLLLVRYSLSYAKAGGILTFYLAITAFGSYFMGRISDSVPRRLIMGLGFFIAAGGLIAAGFAGSFTSFMAFLAVTAVGVSSFHPVMYAHIDETFGARKGRALGVYEASGTAAIMTMLVVNGTLIGYIGTRGVMIVTAIPAILMGSLLLRTRLMDRNIPAESGGAPDGISTDAVPAPASVSHARLSLFVLFLLTIVFRLISVMSVVNFLPTIFARHYGLPTDRAAWATGLFFAGGIAGSITASRFSREDRSYRVLTYGALFISPVIALLAADLPMGARYALVMILGSLGSGLVINQNMILTRLGSRFGRGEAFGILMAVMTLTQSVSPALFGLSVDGWGFQTALIIFSIPVLLSSALLGFLAKPVLGITLGSPAAVPAGR
jgi:MFS family permease